MNGPDPYNLQRFVDAQARVYGDVVAELRAGRKRSHWMWFVFPQVAGLGMSATAQFYAIASLAEARSYLDHPVLGERLRECTGLVLAIEARSVHDIFGSPDDLKFRSSMTLFAAAGSADEPFRQVLRKYCDAVADPRTLDILRRLD